MRRAANRRGSRRESSCGREGRLRARRAHRDLCREHGSYAHRLSIRAYASMIWCERGTNGMTRVLAPRLCRCPSQVHRGFVGSGIAQGPSGSLFLMARSIAFVVCSSGEPPTSAGRDRTCPATDPRSSRPSNTHTYGQASRRRRGVRDAWSSSIRSGIGCGWMNGSKSGDVRITRSPGSSSLAADEHVLPRLVRPFRADVRGLADLRHGRQSPVQRPCRSA